MSSSVGRLVIPTLTSFYTSLIYNLRNQSLMDSSEALQRLAEAMAGEICLAENDPGAIMRRWR
ncbi:MAG: hypothetical protein KAR03_02315, partial [Candidatus Thorarchaeota archaeon]|nr:hypothetical protein [Candidatus Thorarchaeota archaeon]